MKKIEEQEQNQEPKEILDIKQEMEYIVAGLHNLEEDMANLDTLKKAIYEIQQFLIENHDAFLIHRVV